MGPTCRRRTRSTRKSPSARRRKTLVSKKQQELANSKNQENSPFPPPAVSKADDLGNTVEIMSCSSSPCSTPKAERYRIPKVETCPPAPKKRRIVTNCSLRRNSITFFAPPDIELFFNSALCGVPV